MNNIVNGNGNKRRMLPKYAEKKCFCADFEREDPSELQTTYMCKLIARTILRC